MIYGTPSDSLPYRKMSERQRLRAAVSYGVTYYSFILYCLWNAEGGVPYILFDSSYFTLFLTASRRSQHSSPESFTFSYLLNSSYLTLFLTASRRSQHSSSESFMFSHLLNSAYFTLLLADAAAYAKCMIDNSLAVSHGNSRTSKLHTHLTAYALVCIYLYRRIVLNVLQKSTWTA